MSIPPHDYTVVFKCLKLSTLDIRQNMLVNIYLINLVRGYIDATRLLNRFLFHVLRPESRNNQIFKIGTQEKKHLYNDPFQRAMRLIILDTSQLKF